MRDPLYTSLIVIITSQSIVSSIATQATRFQCPEHAPVWGGGPTHLVQPSTTPSHLPSSTPSPRPL